MIDHKIDYSDQTVCFRKHKDGSLTLISLDGIILEHITVDQLNLREAYVPAKGLMWAFVFALVFWGIVAVWYLL